MLFSISVFNSNQYLCQKFITRFLVVQVKHLSFLFIVFVQAPVTTADLKVQLKCQCQGCIVKIRKIVSETKGEDFLSQTGLRLRNCNGVKIFGLIL